MHAQHPAGRVEQHRRERGHRHRCDRLRSDQLRRDEQAVGSHPAPGPLQRTFPARKRTRRAQDPRGNQPGSPVPARIRQLGSLPAPHPPRNPRTGRQLSRRHRPGIPDGVHHPSVPGRVPPAHPRPVPQIVRPAPVRRQRQEHHHLPHRPPSPVQPAQRKGHPNHVRHGNHLGHPRRSAAV
uniref:(northern house mosquito) hypothetical protein n=1 Tax=Culex pipiens TaxID=7175 RepID=A0A8D8JKQ2_CULPI